MDGWTRARRAASAALGAALATTVVAAVGFATASPSGASSPAPDDVYTVNSACGTVTPLPVGSSTPQSAVALGTSPQYAALSPDGNTLYVTNAGSDTVSVVSPTAGTVQSTVPVGTGPEGISVSPDGNWVYVVDSGSHDVRSINAQTLAEGSQAIAGVDPYGIAVTPDGKTAYVTDSGSAVVIPFSLPSLTVGTPIPVGANPEGVAVTPDGSTLYVVDSGSGTVTPVSVATGAPGSPITVGAGPTNIAISPDGTTAVVADTGASSPTLTAISIPSRATQTVGLPAGDTPSDVTWTPDGSTLWVTSSTGDALVPVSVTHSASGPSFSVGTPIKGLCGPLGVVVTPDQAPVATLTPTSATISAGGSVSFSAAGSTVAYGTITLYGWIFGDGQEAQTSGPSVSHIYANPGTYVMELIEEDSAGTANTSVYTGQTMSRNAPVSPFGLAQDVRQAVVTVTSATPPGALPANDPILFSADAGNDVVQPIALGPAGTPTAGGAAPAQPSGPWQPAAGAPIPAGDEPALDAVTPDGRVVVTSNYSGGTVQADLTCSSSGSNPVDSFVPSAAVPTGANPTQVAISPTPVVTATQIEWAVLVADFGASDVREYALSEPRSGCSAPALSLVASLPAALVPEGAKPYGIAITPDGKTAYVSDYGIAAVTPIDLTTDQAGPPIPVGLNPEGIAITPDGKTVYVADTGSNQVTPISTSDNLPGVPIGVGQSPDLIAISSDGAHAYVDNPGSDSVTDILLNTCSTTGCETNTVQLIVPPTGLTISADASTVWVSTCNADAVFPIATATDQVDTAGIVRGLACPVGLAITPDQAPTAQLTQTSYSTVPGGTVSFTANGPSTATYGQITLYGWFFGDGTVIQTTSPTVTHTYSSPGTFVATVYEEDSAGTASTTVFTGQTMSRFAPVQANGLPRDAAQAVIKVSSSSGGPIPVVGTSSLMFSANIGDGTVTPVGLSSTGSPTLGTSFAAGAGPAEVAVTPDGQGAVVTDFTGQAVTPLAVCANSSTGDLDFHVGSPLATANPEPLGVAISPVPVSTSPTQKVWNVYVAEFGGDQVEQFKLTVDSSTCTATLGHVTPLSASLIPVGQTPYAIAITPSGATAYVTNFGSASVTPISLNPAGVGGQTGPPIPVGQEPEGLSITPNGSTVVVADAASNAFTLISTATNTPSTLPTGSGTSPSYVATTPDSTRAYVVNSGSDSVTVIDLLQCTPTACPTDTVDLGVTGYGVVVSPDGSTVWVAARNAGALVPISVASDTVETSNVLTGVPNPYGLAVGPAP